MTHSGCESTGACPREVRRDGFNGQAVAQACRLELRTDEATDQLISEAADLLHVTKSAFVADAARQAAEKIIARSDVTLMSPAVFDTMMVSLDIPDDGHRTHGHRRRIGTGH